MGKNHKRKTPPNELIDRYKKEKEKQENDKNTIREQERIDEEQKQAVEKTKRKENKYVTVIVQNEMRETRRKFRVELQKNVEKDELQNSTKSKKAENYYQRTYNQLLADKSRDKLLKTVTKIQEDELGER